jgi:MerR family transcriptional regulator, light-induced transcriptional regulator
MGRVPAEERVYNIGMASRMSGVPVETIRIWERRYCLPQPARSAGGHRVYSDPDVELLSALRVLVDTGARIGTLAGRPRDELLRASRLSQLRPPTEPEPVAEEPTDFRALIDGLIEVSRTCDTERAEELLDRPLLHRHAREVVLGLYLPLLFEVGELWHAGQLGMASEHFMEKLITGRIHSVLVNQPSRDGPGALCACLPGDRHEVGLLASAVLLKDAGFRVTYLGADMPVTDLLQAVEQRRPRLLVIASTIAVHKSDVAQLAAALQDRTMASTNVVVGGLGGEALAAALGPQAMYLSRLEQLDELARSLCRAS